MKTLVAFTLALLAATLVTLPDAEAKRFGGGKSLGKQYSMPRTAPPAQQATPTRPQAAAPAAQGQAAASGASRWLGPLAGLAAGGLLASLFFGDAFDGLQIMDILLFAALAIGGVMLFRAMRRGSTPSPAPAYGGASGGRGPRAADGGFMPPDMGGTVPSATAGEDEAPTWFDGPAFVEGAKTHFIRLQAAWDQSDFRDIREYTTPQLYAELQRERERLGPSQQFTEVVRLNAELLGVRRDGDVAVASIRFTGLIREEENAGAEAYDETWHVQHAWAAREGDWLITGIQQAEA
jgi:predicted lipid-binding transport protein (Tim44 family)